MARFALTLKDDARANATEMARYPQNVGHVKAASWSGAVRVDVMNRNGVDWCTIAFTRHHGKGRELVLYDGPMSGDISAATLAILGEV